MISIRDAIINVKTMLGCVNRNVAGSAGTSASRVQPWSSLYYVQFWFLTWRVVKFQADIKRTLIKLPKWRQAVNIPTDAIWLTCWEMPEEGPGLSPWDRQRCHAELLKSKLVGATAMELYKALGFKTEVSTALPMQSARVAVGLWFDRHMRWGCIHSPDKLMTY